ncbi:MAG: hypothetical protein AAGE01_10310, partial [Pseudomonadota bacterium]
MTTTIINPYVDPAPEFGGSVSVPGQTFGPGQPTTTISLPGERFGPRPPQPTVANPYGSFLPFAPAGLINDLAPRVPAEIRDVA